MRLLARIHKLNQVLQATLDAGPCEDLSFIVGENGRPLTKESFGNLFRDARRAAGVPGSAHGVRKLAATRMANNGATEPQLMAVFGWTDPKMAAHYTRSARAQPDGARESPNALIGLVAEEGLEPPTRGL